MRNERLFSIGEVSKMFHISISSLRHYEHIGLLNPEYVSPDSGYRYYGPEQFEILNTIRYLRALDMPLDEIESFLKNRDIECIRNKLRQQKLTVHNKIENLKRIEKKIDHRLEWLEDAEKKPLDSISLIHIPQCRLVWVDSPLKIETALDMEGPIRKLDISDAEAVIFLGKVGLGISAESLEKRITDRYDGIFLILDREDVYKGKTSILPETDALQLHFRGSHKEARAQYGRLLDYIDSNNMHISGFSREVTLIDYGVTNDTNEFVTEITIPVTSG